MKTRIPLSEENIRKYAYHSTESQANVFHLCRNCQDGNNIEKEYRAGGKGDKKDLCEECRKLLQKNRCQREMEQSVVNREEGLDKFKEMQKRNPNLK